MEYVLAVALTLLFGFSIIVIVAKREKKKLKRILYRQSDFHHFMKHFISQGEEVKKIISQSEKRMQEKTIKVIITDDKAYWVLDNVFYMSDLDNGKPDPLTTKPVDAVNVTKEDLDKLMFILDNLNKEGDTDDDSSSGN